MSTSPLIPQLTERQNAMLDAMGVDVWWHPVGHETPAPAPVPIPVFIPVSTPVPAPAPAPVVPAMVVVPRSSASVGGLAWPALTQAITTCSQCALSQHRQHAVVGQGDTQRPDYLFVGEAPDEEEDQQGLPFVGLPGQLLDRMLAAMQRQREHGVYLTHVVKCRAPSDRTIDARAVQQCSSYLLQQIELLQPRLIVALGRFAALAVLDQGGCLGHSASQALPPLGTLRGHVHTARFGEQAVPVVATYSPTVLLRTPEDKAKAWADLCLAMDTVQAGR